MKKILLSIVTAVALSGSLMAGENPGASESWSGFYAGLQTGESWDYADAHIDAFQHGVYIRSIEIDDINSKRPYAGIHVGYNWVFHDEYLFGIQGDVNMKSNKGSKSIPHPWNTNYDQQIRENMEAALYARLGKIFDDSYMPYLLGGVSWSSVSTRAYYRPNPNHPDVQDVQQWKSDKVLGWTLGAGVELKISEQIHLSLQYRYSDYKNPKVTMNQNAFNKYFPTEIKNYHTHTVQAAISFYF